ARVARQGHRHRSYRARRFRISRRFPPMVAWEHLENNGKAASGLPGLPPLAPPFAAEARTRAAITALRAVIADDRAFAFEADVPVARGHLDVAEHRDVALELQDLVDLAGLAAGYGGLDLHRKLARRQQPHHHAVARPLARCARTAIDAVERLSDERCCGK